MNPPALALSAHAPDETLALGPQGPVTAARFFADAQSVAEALPASQYVLNTCHDRYLFMVGLGAALLAGRPTLMPSSLAPESVRQLQERYPQLLCLHDGQERPEGLPAWPVAPPAAGAARALQDAPLIEASQVAAIVFTSGTTGAPTAHLKRWGGLCADGEAEARRIGSQGLAIIATVPSQHMYGLESSVMLTLRGGARLWRERPFYPADICAALRAAPGPRMLVTTPFHLGALLAAQVALPSCEHLLCSTAPLPVALARQAEAAFGSPLTEIYGCTESGQIATRRPTQDEAWHLLDGVQLDVSAEGAWAHGGHVQIRVKLSDHIEPLDERRFRLGSRHADMVNVAGKRASLSALTAQLLGVEGVTDGCFFLPQNPAAEKQASVQRLAALVVAAPGMTPERIMAALRQRMDPAFLPRPLLPVPALPRNATGKIVAKEVQALYQTLCQPRAR